MKWMRDATKEPSFRWAFWAVVLGGLGLILVARFAFSQSLPVPGGAGGGGGAPTSASYLLGATNSSLSNASVLSGRPVALGSGAASILNPLTTLYLAEEFASGLNTSVNIGALGWATSGGTITMQAAEAGRPGILRRDTSATQNTDAYLHPRTTGTTGIVSPADTFDVLWIIRVNQADNNTRVRIGLANSAVADPPNDGIYFERLETDTDWFAVSRIGSSTGRAVTGMAMDTNWIRLRIRRTSATTVTYNINGGVDVAATASVTNAQLQPFTFITNPTAAAAKTLDHDYFDLVVSGLNR